MVNSKRKGSRGELMAVHFLRSLGFADARRTVQYNGKAEAGQADVVCPETLPGVHFEVKVVKGMRLGNELFHAACQQAERDANGKVWCVLWREHGRRQWLLTKVSGMDTGYLATLSSDRSIGYWLNKHRSEVKR